jgi:hypothetical protein
MKPIRITPYAERRISARKISPDMVKNVVRNPDQIVPDEDNENREIYQSLFTDIKGRTKLLRVVIEESSDEISVVTAYPTSKIKKYWRI